MESLATEGESPVGVKAMILASTRVPQDTSNPAGIREDHLPRLNTTHRPIVHKYREGKVKRTPARGVK